MTRAPLRRLAGRFLRSHCRAVALASAISAVGVLLGVAAPLAQARVLDHLAAGGSGGVAPQALVWAGVAAACLAGRALLGWRAGAVMARVSQEAVRDLTLALHRKLHRLPLPAVAAHTPDGLLTRTTSDVGSVMILLNTGTLQLAGDLILAAGAAAAVGWLDWRLAVVLAGSPVLSWANARCFARPLDAAAGGARGRLGEAVGVLGERLAAARVVAAFGRGPREQARVEEAVAGHAAATRRWVRAAAAQFGLAAVTGELGTAAVLLAGAAEVLAGRLSAGELVAVYTLAGLVYGPVARLLQSQAGIAATRVAADRILEVLDATAAEPPTAPSADAIEPGVLTAVLGPSGCGKSTLLNRLAAGGAVLVPQRPVVFRGTVRSNLLYADPAADPARLWAALEAAELADHVRTLPGGLDAPVAERGADLSGGQRQRLALARGLLADPEVLLLDDPTSALDPATAGRVWANLSAWAVGRTVVAAAHAVPGGCRPSRVVELARPQVRAAASVGAKPLCPPSGVHRRAAPELLGRHGEIAQESDEIVPSTGSS